MRILSALAIAGAMLVATQPAAGQITKAPAAITKRAIKVETVAKGLVHPWGLAFLPDGRLLVTERPGRMRIVGKDGKLSEPLQGSDTVCRSDRPVACEPASMAKWIARLFFRQGIQSRHHCTVRRLLP